ncbi:CYTH domain-containing protein [Sulfurifustis variabilis]|nr:CYTH domain-containing protein [Sulfurifustis variabilis]
MNPTEDIEIESKLVVISDRTEEILEGIAATGELAGLTLVPMTEQSIRDIYFDTRSHALRAADLALRLRRVNWTSVLGLKGKSRRVAGAIERLEVERPWSADGLAEIAGLLRRYGAPVAEGATPPAVHEPEPALESLGLLPIQERLTQRARRQIVDRERAVVGELAIDRSVFVFEGSRVRHFEIEIEAAGRERFGGMAALSAALLAAWPGELRPWEHSKVATGRAIEHLMATRPPALLMGSSGGFNEAAYEAMDRWLRAP